MLITSTVDICIQHLGRAEEMAFTAQHSYASTVLGVVILSVCHMRAFWLIQRTYRRHFYTTWKGNPSSQMWFFVQLCSSWQDFNWLKRSRGLSAAAELLVKTTPAIFIDVLGDIPEKTISSLAEVTSSLPNIDRYALTCIFILVADRHNTFIYCNTSMISMCADIVGIEDLLILRPSVTRPVQALGP